MVKLLEQPKVLLVDSYDSFTHNLAALISQAIPASEVFIVRNDGLKQTQLLSLIPYFSAVVVGPGPGSPAVTADVGIVKDLWHLSDTYVVPIFGVCLGLQSLGVEYGATLKRLDVVKHGLISRIQHDGDPLFEGVEVADVVRYHSLHVEVAGKAPKLQELAWVDDGEVNGGRVVMAVKHRTRPFWAVQYHPESVRTDGSGLRVLQNFWTLGSRWRALRGRRPLTWDALARETFGHPWPHLRHLCAPSFQGQPRIVATSPHHLPQLSIVQICESLGVYKNSSDFVLLDAVAKPGRYSIIGCLSPSTLKISHFIGDRFVWLHRGKERKKEPLGSEDIWTWLATLMQRNQAVGGNSEIPFWGGLVGFLSYELGVDTLGIKIRHHHGQRHPDVNLAFVERSIVVDNHSGGIHLQSIIPCDVDWFISTAWTLKHAADAVSPDGESLVVGKASISPPHIKIPNKELYIAKVNLAKEHLFSGESYELCVTARTHIEVPKSSSWDLYKTVRVVNPAPYAAYLRLNPSTLVSSSPERFVSFSRPPTQRFQLRPIKGTVRKGGTMTPAAAEEILSSPKEVAENLMIVDLIRHDLYGILGNNVKVHKFCGIEEYETVWQLVSVIEGVPPATHEYENCGNQLGWEVLRRSLPPGSMTGAPKKRSVEILQDIEDDERSIYSGVVGYYCVSGAGDWSVVIRSCFKYDGSGDLEGEPDEARPLSAEGTEEWVLGSGGAITALSDPEAEWDEMEVKLQSVLRAFAR